ncbi:Uncharacterised protein [Klebsiella pneumoniae]|nr:Uncharacterised protein [Klebsiella pneumoniae]
MVRQKCSGIRRSYLALNATAILKERAQALQLHAQGAVWEGENRHFLKKMLNKLESYLLILK